MKYKNIAGVLYDFADSFTSESNVVARDTTMGYLARRANRGLGTRLTFDVLSGKADPPEMAASPVDQALTAYAAWFPKLLESQNVLPSAIVDVRLDLEFQTGQVRESIGFPDSSEMPVDCTATATDHRGREHVIRFRRWLTFYESDPDDRSRSPHSAMR